MTWLLQIEIEVLERGAINIGFIDDTLMIFLNISFLLSE
jgi:hypothetical protein